MSEKHLVAMMASSMVACLVDLMEVCTVVLMAGEKDS